MVTPSHSPSGCCAFNRAAAHILNGLWGFFSCSVGPGSFREETDTLVRCLANAGWFCRRILRRCFLRSASSKVGASSTESSDFVSKSSQVKETHQSTKSGIETYRDPHHPLPPRPQSPAPPPHQPVAPLLARPSHPLPHPHHFRPISPSLENYLQE